MTPTTRLRLVLLCLFLSGLAALLYETVWTREFAFVFGTSDLAVATVLAGYMGGLALGAAVASRWVTRVRRPILTYALLELGIAGAALAVPTAIAASTWLLVAIAGGRPDPPAEGALGTAGFYLLASFLILMVPTSLMGATLPFLARHAVRTQEEVGRRVGQLYATNTAGAVAGTLATAFFLLPALGLRRTVWVGVALNALVFVVAAALARGVVPRAGSESAASGRTPPKAALGRDRAAWVLPLILVSGAVSFGYEVLWTRLLGHVLGGSVYAFATMLASFLVGIAGGSVFAARFATTPRRAALGFAVAQVAVALFSAAAFASLDRLPAFAQAIGAGGVSVDLGVDALLAASVLLPGALGIGATFPFAVRTLARDEIDAGPVSGRVYAWNTVGAIVGSIAAGFVVIPALGYAGTVTGAIGINLVLAVLALALVPPAPRWAFAAVALAALPLVLAPPTTPWRLLRASPFDIRPSEGRIAYFGVGRAATVMMLDAGGEWQLRTNGLHEAAIEAPGGRPGRHAINAWLSVLPVLVRPEARSMLVIGLGGGVTVEAAPSSLEHIDVIELEPEVVAANRAIGDRRRLDPLADPRVRVTVNDARSALLLSERRYDAIVSQPSHPWTAGASHLYTREFFELVKRRLQPDGVFVQWIALPFLDEGLLRSLLATLHSGFAEVRVYQPSLGALLFVASDGAIEPERHAARVAAAHPHEWAVLGIQVGADVAAALALDEHATRELARGAPLNTDDHNRVAIESPRLMQTRRGRQEIQRVLAQHDPLAADGASWDRVYLVRRLLGAWSIDRAMRLAQTIREPAARDTARGYVVAMSGRPEEARRAFERAMDRGSGALDAQAGWLQLRREALRDGDPEVLAVAASLDDIGRAVVEAWAAEDAQDWAAVGRLDARLAAAPPTHPLYGAAGRLRAGWRVADGDPRRCAEALDVLDAVLAYGRNPTDLMLRAEAARCSGRLQAALAALGEAGEFAPPGSPLAQEIARRRQSLSRAAQSRR